MRPARLHTAANGSPLAEADCLACLVWRFESPLLVASTASVGGGIGRRDWLLNAQVRRDYRRHDVGGHIAQIADAVGLPGVDGVGLLTAADVARVSATEDGSVGVEATVGVTLPVWAASPDDILDAAAVAAGAGGPGTINTVVFVPRRHTDGALANLLCTVTEAKAQALADGGVPGTGTASDAVAVVCPADGEVESFGGPRSAFGARAARAVHAAILSAIESGKTGS